MENTAKENLNNIKDEKDGCAPCSCHKKARPRSAEAQKLLQNRLNRMIGQLGGIKKMIEENRYCGDVLVQVAAVESALQSFGYIVLKDHMETCVTDEVKAGNPDIMDETLDLIKKIK